MAAPDAPKFPVQPFTKEMARSRVDNCEAKAALYGYEFAPSVPSPQRHQGKHIPAHPMREAPFATDNGPVQQRGAPPPALHSPYAMHDDHAAAHGHRRAAAPKEVRAAPFATYDQAVTGNAYAEYERNHELKAFPKDAFAPMAAIPRAPVNERPFAVYDVDARENYPANYIAKPAGRDVVHNSKITQAPQQSFDMAAYEANRAAVAVNARRNSEAPFACGGNFDAAPARNPGYQARHRQTPMDGAAESGGKITGNGKAFNPQHYHDARAENVRLHDAQYQRKYVGAGNFLAHP